MEPVETTTQRQVRFTPRPQDMVAAQRCFYMMRLRSRATLISLVISLGIVALFIRIAMPDASWPWIAFVFGAALLGGILVPLAMMRWYVPFLARRVFRQQRSLHREVTVEWDEIEFRSATEAGRSRIAWTDYFRWREDGEIILLFHAENLFQFLPKRVVSNAQIEDLRAIAVRANLKGAASKRQTASTAQAP